MNTIHFKTCTNADLPTIQQLAEKIWRSHYSSIITTEQIDYMLSKMYSTESLQQQMKEDGCHFILELINEKPVGFISISEKKIVAKMTSNTSPLEKMDEVAEREFLQQHSADFFIHKLYVDTTQHRNGLGKALLDEALSRCENWKTIRLTVNRQNFKAINFYFKNGFTIEEVANFEIGNGFVMNDFLMVKVIGK